MKKLLLSVALLIAATLSAQTAPDNYDGGSALRAAILKSKNKQTSAKSKSKTKHVVIKQVQPPTHTEAETQYYLIYKEESPSYLRKLLASEYWQKQKEIAHNAEIESDRLYAEQAPQRKEDSIARVEKQNQLEQKQKITMLKYKHAQDSIKSKRATEDNAYIEEQKRQQKENNSFKNRFLNIRH